MAPVIPVQGDGQRGGGGAREVEDTHICELSDSSVVTARCRGHAAAKPDVHVCSQAATTHLSAVAKIDVC